MNLTPVETARVKELQAKPENQRSDAEKQELGNLLTKRDHQ